MADVRDKITSKLLIPTLGWNCLEILEEFELGNKNYGKESVAVIVM